MVNLNRLENDTVFNIVNRAAKRIKKLCEYHNRKADRYEALARYYAVKAQQHRTAAKAYMSGASTIALETADLTVYEMKVNAADLTQRITTAHARNAQYAMEDLAC